MTLEHYLLMNRCCETNSIGVEQSELNPEAELSFPYFSNTVRSLDITTEEEITTNYVLFLDGAENVEDEKTHICHCGTKNFYSKINDLKKLFIEKQKEFLFYLNDYFIKKGE